MAHDGFGFDAELVDTHRKAHLNTLGAKDKVSNCRYRI